MAEIPLCNRFNAPSHIASASANMQTAPSAMSKMMRGEISEVDGLNPADYSVLVKDLDFTYPAAEEICLNKVTLKLGKGRRCLLCGDNGAGKTTLLRILGGKHHVPEEHVRILGRQGMFSPELNILRSYLGGDWGKKTVAFA